MVFKKVSIVCPVFNEESTIDQIIVRIQKAKTKGLEKEIIIVDDGSTDNTSKKLKKYKAKKGFKIIIKKKNAGKGNALRTGFKHVTGEIILLQDADLEYSPADYPNLITPILNNETKIVYGSRVLGFRHYRKLEPNFKGKNKISYFFFSLGGLILTVIANVLYNAKITDEATCYKVFHKDILKDIKLKCKHFEFCPEFTAKVRKKGYKIVEVPIRYNPRSVSQGKKIKFSDGIMAIWTLIKYRFIN